MPKILHFADAHIDMKNYGQHDPASGLPLRVMDFLKSLDTIVETAISEKVDMVIFAGDAYRDRNPQPTFQREWGGRMMKLSRAGIPTLLVTGNHDVSPAQVRAHSMQEFETLEPAYIHVVSKPVLLNPKDLDGVPVQILGIPWITRAGLVASSRSKEALADDPARTIESMLSDMIDDAIKKLDPELPTILAAHASVEGAKFGNEQTIKIGKDVLLQPRLVCNPRFDYVALGHIHKYQNLNEGSYPPVIYPGSIERVDFGELNEDKGFVIADVRKGHTTFERRILKTRRFISVGVQLEEGDDVMAKLKASLPTEEDAKGAIIRLMIDYPQALETMIDDKSLDEAMSGAFEFRRFKELRTKARARLDVDEGTSFMSPMELIELYWKENNYSEASQKNLQSLANQVMSDVNGGLDA